METKNSEALFQWRSEVVTNGAIIVGGQDSAMNLLSEVYYYQAKTDDWFVLPNTKNDLRGAEALRLRNDYYVFCGLTHQFARLNEVERISIEEITETPDSEPFIVYPNPSNGNVAINASGDQIIEGVDVFNSTGYRLESMKNATSQGFVLLNLEGYQKGIYVLKIYGDQKVKSVKLIIL